MIVKNILIIRDIPLKTELKIGFRCSIICIYNLLLTFFHQCVYYVSLYVTMSISTGLYPNLDL